MGLAGVLFNVPLLEPVWPAALRDVGISPLDSMYNVMTLLYVVARVRLASLLPATKFPKKPALLNPTISFSGRCLQLRRLNPAPCAAHCMSDECDCLSYHTVCVRFSSTVCHTTHCVDACFRTRCERWHQFDTPTPTLLCMALSSALHTPIACCVCVWRFYPLLNTYRALALCSGLHTPCPLHYMRPWLALCTCGASTPCSTPTTVLCYFRPLVAVSACGACTPCSCPRRCPK